jgi:hypothetical protein
MGVASRGAASASIPGKTFLVGEYLALEGGPSLIAATEPRFEARFRRESGAAPEAASGSAAASPGFAGLPFHAESPAGRLWARLGPASSGWSVEFSDPHFGLGGLGASTAQFASVLAFGERLGAWDARLNRSSAPDWQLILDIYRQVAWSGEGWAPSGADLLAQIAGGLCAVYGPAPGPAAGHVSGQASSQAARCQVFAWPFAELDFTLLRTGAKLATHDHLRALGSSGEARDPLAQAIAATPGPGAVNETGTPGAEGAPKREAEPARARLRFFAHSAIEALAAGDEALFVFSVEAYGACLRAIGLCAPRTTGLVERAQAAIAPPSRGLAQGSAEPFAAKGCGAMGADLIAVLHRPRRFPAVEAWARAEGLRLAGRARDLAPQGLRFMAEGC